MLSEFREGQILRFLNPMNCVEYDGVVWRVCKEDETNVSIFIRFVDKVN